MNTIAIIAALDRELSPLVSGWKRSAVVFHGKIFRVYEHENLVAVAGGIGCRAAESAARAIVAQYRPQPLTSACPSLALLPPPKGVRLLPPPPHIAALT